MEDCIFCKIIKGTIPAKIVTQNDDVVVFLSLENHPLIVTKNHFDNVYNLDDRSASEVMKMAVKIANAVKIGLNADGVNLIQSNEPAAHQDVFHFHLHIIPRFHQDAIKLSFPHEDIPEQKKTSILEKIKAALN